MLLVEGKLKYLEVKFRKGLKKTEMAASGIIKTADGLCVRILLFLLCQTPKGLLRVDADLLRAGIAGDSIEDEEILDALDYFKERNVLDYAYEKVECEDAKGANMAKIVSLIGDISDIMNDMNDMSGMAEAARYAEPATAVFGAAGGDGGDEDDGFEAIDTFETPHDYDNDGNDSDDSDDSGGDGDAFAVIDAVCSELEKNGEFRHLFDAVQRNLKVFLAPAELEMLHNFYVRMDGGLLLGVSKYCGENSKNPRSVVSYFRRAVMNLADEGITTGEQYDKRLADAQKARDYEAKVRKIFGIGDDVRLTAKEWEYVKTWALEYELSEEMLAEGYYGVAEKDEDKANIRYLNTIYRSWHAKGFKTVEEVRSEFRESDDLLKLLASVKPLTPLAGGKKGGRKAKRNSDTAGFNAQDFFDKIARESRKLPED